MENIFTFITPLMHIGSIKNKNEIYVYKGYTTL